MARFDRVIPPGGEGSISLQIKTKGYQGKITKSARVYTNDPDRPMTVLRVTGFVRTPIVVEPKVVRIYSQKGRQATASVLVTAGKERPLNISPVHFSLDGKLTYVLEEIEKERRYRIRFTTVPGPAEAYSGVLTLETNYPEKPRVLIRIKGRIARKS